MVYSFKHKHVSQLFDHGGDGVIDGGNDCGPAAMARYLRESGYPWDSDDVSLVERLRLKMTGAPDGPHNGYVSVSQLTGYLEACGLPYRVSTDPHAVLSPWTLCLIRGVRLQPAQYPPSWFGGVDAVDHFILQMADGWTNDPLANGMHPGSMNDAGDCWYTQESLLSAAQGGLFYQLPTPLTLAWTQQGDSRTATVQPPRTLAGYVAVHDQDLRPTPAVFPPKGQAVGPRVAAGTELAIGPAQAPWGTTTTQWRRVQAKDGHVGWMLATNVQARYS